MLNCLAYVMPLYLMADKLLMQAASVMMRAARELDRRGYHEHKCVCGHRWIHQRPERPPCTEQEEKERRDRHTCPKCERVVFSARTLLWGTWHS